MSKVILSRYPFRSPAGREYKVIVRETEVSEGEKCFQVELYQPVTRQKKGAFGRAKTEEDFLLVYLNSYPVHGVNSHVEMVYRFVSEYESKPNLIEDPVRRRRKAIEELEAALSGENEKRPAGWDQQAAEEKQTVKTL